MSWFYVDDQFPLHPKAIAAGNAALGLWVRAGAWCSGYGTSGFVPRDLVTTLGGKKRDADRLVSAGLWEAVDGGYMFRDWEHYQKPKEAVNRQKELNRERQRRFREARRDADRNVTGSVTNGVTNAPPMGEGISNTSSVTSSVTEEQTTLTLVTGDGATGVTQKRSRKRGTYAEHPAFEEFWSRYPRSNHSTRKDAAMQFTKAVARVGVDVVMDGVTRYAGDPNRTTDPQFIPGAQKWLNGERWADAPAQPSRSGMTTRERQFAEAGERYRAAVEAEGKTLGVDDPLSLLGNPFAEATEPVEDPLTLLGNPFAEPKQLGA